MTEYITLGAGCFWCLDAAMRRLAGVQSVESGYCNGEKAELSYEQVCTGRTGAVEVVRVGFDPQQVRLEDLLILFFKLHDPTQLNRQGADVGTQYRSGIYYESAESESAARAFVAKLEADQVFSKPIVTEIRPLQNYCSAEGYHQNYYAQNPQAGYCAYVIAPKLQKAFGA